jgi:hypothetical protein
MAARKTKLNKLDRYLIFSIIVLLVYTVAEMTVSSLTGIDHSTLTTCVFSAFGGEFFFAGLIKIFNIKKGEQSNYG